MELIANRPDFFIVGAPKSGTTSLYEYLVSHPEVFMCEPKEPNYFSTDLVRRRHLTEEEYLALFHGPSKAKRTGEASATYIYSEDAPHRIKQFDADARIIMILRNPVDMIYSLHAQHVWNGRDDIVDFEEALAAEEYRKRGERLPTFPPAVQMLFYRERGDYVPHVETYLEVFGRERVLILIFEEFVSDTSDAFAKVCDFLGIDSNYDPDFTVHNANKTLRSVSLRQLPMSPAARAVAPFVPRSLKEGTKRLLVRVNTKIEKRPPMGTEIRCQLESEFAESISQLSRILDRDLTEVWKPFAQDEDREADRGEVYTAH